MSFQHVAVISLVSGQLTVTKDGLQTKLTLGGDECEFIRAQNCMEKEKRRTGTRRDFSPIQIILNKKNKNKENHISSTGTLLGTLQYLFGQESYECTVM